MIMKKRRSPTVIRYYCTKYPPMVGIWPLGRLQQNAEAFYERRYIPEIDRMAWG